MTSSRTKKETAQPKRKQHHQQQNIKLARWSTLVISRIFLPLFFSPRLVLVESSHEVFKTEKEFERAEMMKDPPILYRYSERTKDYTHSCLSIPT
jgi:hypothetical protein